MQLVFQKPHKSIQALPNIELSDFTVLTGVNGAGKSHLLEGIENGSIQVNGIVTGNSNNSNQVRRFDWSNLVPNDTQSVNPYTLTQERDNHWKTLSSQAANYKSHIKKILEQSGVHDVTDAQIYELASLNRVC